MNERQPNSPEHKDCSGWQHRRTWLQWLMWPSTQRIGKDIGASSYFFHWKGSRCTFWGLLHWDDHDKLVAMDLSMIAVALTPSWLVWILTVIPVWLYFSSFLLCPVLFLNTKLIYCRSVRCVWFSLPYVSFQSNWAWKPLKLGLSISFTLRIFVSIYVTIT